MSTPLTVENLYDLVDDAVRAATNTTFLAQLQNSPSVHDVFFANVAPATIPSIAPDWVDSVACAMVCSAISITSLYGFSVCVDGNKANNFWQVALNSQMAVAVGRPLYDGLFGENCRGGDHKFSDYLNETPAVWAAQLADYVTTDQFVNNEILKLIAQQANWLQYLNLILYKLQRLDPTRVDAVLARWTRAYSDKGIVQNWQTYNFIPAAHFAGDVFIAAVNVAVSVCRTQQGPEVYHTQGGAGGGGGFSHDSETDYYGEAVQTFVARGGGAQFSTGQGPSANVKTTSSNPCCFIAGTTILLADGSAIAIESLQSGDVVVTKDGGIALHSDEKVVITLPQDSTIFGINDDAPFFTAGHPFSTAEGWKAIDPEIAREENPSLKVSRLGIGDTVYRVISREPLTYEAVVIKQIRKVRLAAGEKVYGLHLIDGHHSYHANGFLVRMNYPMLTEQRLLDGFSRLSPEENALVSTQLQPIMPFLKRAVGSFIEAPINQALTRARLVAAKKKIQPQETFHRINSKYQVRVFNASTALYHDHTGITELHLQHGILTVDGVAIVKPVFNHDTLTWIQQVKGQFSSGVLHFTKDRLACAGHIYQGSNSRGAIRYEVSAVTPPSIYTSQVATVSTSIIPSVPLDKSVKTGDLQQGPDIQIGYEYKQNADGTNLPVAVIKIRTKQNQKWSIDISSYVSLTVDPLNQNLQMKIVSGQEMAAGVGDYGTLFPTGGELEFASDANSYSGYMQEYDSASGTTPAVYYYWLGTVIPAQPAPARSESLARRGSHEAAPLDDRVVHFEEKGEASDDPLSLAELFTLSPQRGDLQTLSQNMLMENMRWAIGAIPGNTWLNDFFGELQPTLSKDRITVIEQDLDFYQSRLAYAYLGWGIGNMSGMGAPSNPLSPDEKARLKIFLHDGLAKEPGYNKQSNDINIRAFGELCPRIFDYLADKTANWGQQLYDAISTNQQINLLMNRFIATQDMSLCYHNATLLTILSPGLVSKYLSNFPMFSLMTIMNQPQFKDSKDSLEKWLPDFINTFIKQYETLPTNPTAAQITKQALAVELKEFSEQAGSLAELVDALTDVIINSYGSSLNDRAESAMSLFSSKYPKLAKFVGFLQATMWGFALFQAIVAFKNWQTLSDADRAKLIVSMVALTGKLIEAIPEIIGTVKLGFNALVKLKNFCAGNAADYCEELTAVDKRFIADGGDFLGNIFNVERKVIDVEGTLYDKFFENASRFLRWLGPVVAGANAGLCDYTFVEDLIHGAPTEQEAFDGIIAASTTLETVCLTLEVLDIGAAFCGPAAAVLAIVGVIFSIVEAFLPKPKPESPTDKFMDELRSNFLASLSPVPPARAEAFLRVRHYMEIRGGEFKSEQVSRSSRGNLALFFSRPNNVRGSVLTGLPSRPRIEGGSAAVAAEPSEQSALVVGLRVENRLLREQLTPLLKFLEQSQGGGQANLSLQLVLAQLEQINRHLAQLSTARQDLAVPLSSQRTGRVQQQEPEIKEEITQHGTRDDVTPAKSAPTMGNRCCVIS